MPARSSPGERTTLKWKLGREVIVVGTAGVLISLLILTSCGLPFGTSSAKPASTSSPSGATPIKHVIIIMQENRSFDTYFGTYPGADGIPMQNGVPTVCVPDPADGQVRQALPRSATTSTTAARTAQANATADIDGGKMDGFIAQARGKPRALRRSLRPGCVSCRL